MENDIVYYHKELQKNIRAVERDETDQYALNAVKENFLKLFDMIKMIMILCCIRLRCCNSQMVDNYNFILYNLLKN